jgi:hypothetical protein
VYVTNVVTLKGFSMMTLTTDEIIEMARQAGATVTDFIDHCFAEDVVLFTSEELKAFAKLVATNATEREREACAKVCEDFSKTHGLHTKHCVAAAIRARGQHDSNS